MSQTLPPPPPPAQLPARPRLRAGVARVWRDAGTVQIGLEPPRCVVLGGAGPGEERLVARLLEGGREVPALVAAAAADGVDPGAVHQLLAALARHDLLEPEPSRAELLSRATVVVHPVRPVGFALARTLTAAGVGCVLLTDPEPRHVQQAAARLGAAPVRVGVAESRQVVGVDDRPLAAVTLAVLGTDRPGLPAAHHTLLRAGVPHLAVAVVEDVVRVGPLVLPGRGGCLRCLELHRTDRDPAWPLVAAQAATPLRRAPTRPRVDPATASLAASLAARHALGFLVDPDAPHPLRDAGIEVPATDGVPLVRRWRAHPSCGCLWSGAEATMTA